MIDTELQNAVFALMRRAGDVMLGARQVEASAGAVSVKPGDANYVTVYDVKVQELLIEGLSALFPCAVFLAEESAAVQRVPDAGDCFVIDPIDGTTNFIHDMQCSAISVALFRDGAPCFGAVFDPYRDEMFHAVSGGGAFLNGAPIRASVRDVSHALVCFGTSPYDRAALCEKSFALVKRFFLRCADIRRSGSAAIDICCVACGRTDVFFEAILSPWDFAAGGLILREAGGRMTDFSGGEIPAGSKSSVLCTNARLHDAALQIINED